MATAAQDPSSPEASAACSVSAVGRAAAVAYATRMAAKAVSAARAEFWTAVAQAARCAA